MNAGASVVDRRVGVNDFLATICKAVGVDCTAEFRRARVAPIRIVE